MLLSQSEDEGKALENIVYMILERSLKEDDRVFYFSEAKECDFVIQRGDQIEELVQVCWELEETNLEREVGGILAASSVTDCRTCKIITFNQQRTIQRDELRIEVLPIWRL